MPKKLTVNFYRTSALCLLAALALARTARAQTEAELRARLGIPAEAKSVLVFAQSSHVDPDWLLTADQYQHFTDKAFDGAMVELARDPRYVYSVECIFFFRRYWEKHPELQAKIRDYVNTGRIRFSGVGVTTPDTLLPEGENILRDYLIGWNWLKLNGMNVNPRIAYLPDDFGHSPTLPTMLQALGLKYAVMTRVDGGSFPMADWAPAKDFPRPGSTYELLFRKLNIADFIWPGPDGSEVLAHVTPTFYDMGDLIDHTSGAAMVGLYLALPARSPAQTNQKIDGYIAKLKPFAPTGYMWAPMGGDFMPPVKNVLKYVDEYNRTRYPLTGTYVVLAAVEDYMDLVAFHKDKLPTIKLDPNPYWTGFYSSRPGLKQACRDLSRSLLLAEARGVMAEDRGTAKYPDLSAAWYISAMSNHHDFITGTSRNAVLKNEQLKLLARSQLQVDEIIGALITQPQTIEPPVVEKLLYHREESGKHIFENRYYIIELDEKKGGCITRWFDRSTGREMISGPSNDIVIYRDSGGLYSMGMEVYKGIFNELDRSSRHQAVIFVPSTDRPLVAVYTRFHGQRWTQFLLFDPDTPTVDMVLIGHTRGSSCVTVQFRPALIPGRFVQNLTYGVVERPLARLFTPTFWAVKDWVDLIDISGQYGINLALGAPGAVAARSDGSIEAVALRNAKAERTLGFIPALQTVVANGTDPDVHEFRYAFWPHGAESWLERRPWEQVKSLNTFEDIFEKAIKLDRPDVTVTAVKKSEAGDGVVVRLFKYGPGPETVKLTFNGKPVKSATLIDALEREMGPLPVGDGQVTVEMPYALASVLLKF